MFAKFPKIGYVVDNEFHTLVDIFRRVAINPDALNKYDLEFYLIKDGENPEDVAYKLYNNPSLHWTVLISNNIIDPYNDWYMSQAVLNAYVDEKYGAGGRNSTHHWVLPSRPEICVEYDSAKLAAGEIVEVSNFEHEEILNEAKREIKVISQRDINDFVRDFTNLIRV